MDLPSPHHHLDRPQAELFPFSSLTLSHSLLRGLSPPPRHLSCASTHLPLDSARVHRHANGPPQLLSSTSHLPPSLAAQSAIAPPPGFSDDLGPRKSHLTAIADPATSIWHRACRRSEIRCFHFAPSMAKDLVNSRNALS